MSGMERSSSRKTSIIDDETERDDAVEMIAGEHRGNRHGNFKRARHANQIDARLRNDVFDFLEGVVDERVREFLVVLRGDDADADF